MKVIKNTVEKITLTELAGLDPITLIIEDFSNRRGKVMIECYGKAWSAYFGDMGKEKISEFIHTADVEYLVGKLTTEPRSVIDYDKISEKIGIQVELETLLLHTDELSRFYGNDYIMNLPEKDSYSYRYLCRVVTAVKEAMRLEVVA